MEYTHPLCKTNKTSPRGGRRPCSYHRGVTARKNQTRTSRTYLQFIQQLFTRICQNKNNKTSSNQTQQALTVHYNAHLYNQDSREAQEKKIKPTTANAHYALLRQLLKTTIARSAKKNAIST